MQFSIRRFIPSFAVVFSMGFVDTTYGEGKASSQLPLSGVQVLDLGFRDVGSMAGLVLADLGATVIHAQNPGVKQPIYAATLDRGKYCVPLSFDDPKDLSVVYQLAKRADIVIEDFRPEELKCLGLDLAVVRKANPSVITLSLPPFSKFDEVSLRHRKATDATILAHSGVFSRMGPNRTLMGEEPSFSPLPMASAYAAVIGTSAAVMALQAREDTGRGDTIETSCAAALTEGLLTYNTLKVTPTPKRYMNLREEAIAKGVSGLSYEALFSSKYMDPFFRPYRCKDGRTYYLVSIAHQNHAERAMKALGVYDEIMDKIKLLGSYPVNDVYQSKKDWGNGGSFATYPVSREWSVMISEILERAFLTKTAVQWEGIFAERGVVGGAHRTLQEWMHEDHVKQSGLMTTVNDVKLGPMLQPGHIVWSDTLAEDYFAAPRSRQFITAKEALALFTPRQVRKPEDKKRGWLEGKKVLDLCNVIAGPHAGTVMARYGADVIKLDSASPMFGPSFIFFAFNTGQGKKSILVDIRSEAGYKLLVKLIKQSDIVTFNATSNQLKRLGLDPKSIQKINPDVIFCHLDLFGGPRKGPWSDRLGYDDIAQAVSGIMTRFGGVDTPEEHAHLGTLDVMCGFAATLSIAAAMYRQKKTGQSDCARTSLSAMSGLLQLPYAYDFLGRGPWDEASGRGALGNHPLSHFYECEDGWVYMDSSCDEISKLETVFPGLAKLKDQASFLQATFKTNTVAFWITALAKQDIAVARLNSLEEIREKYTTPAGSLTHPGSYAFQLWDESQHPSGLAVTHVSPCAVKTTTGRMHRLSPTEKYGHSTSNVLRELQNEALLGTPAVSEGWSQDYLPK